MTKYLQRFVNLADKSLYFMSETDEKQHEWFTNWFNSPYYRLLYKERNEQEARLFIDNLLSYLQPQPKATVLDLACGSGRYARYLAERDLYVTGLDIAPSNIHTAREFESERLSFFTHDMRNPYAVNYFNYVFNFFTSFGYFETEEEHLVTLKHISRSLRPAGIFMIDFLNAQNIIENLVAHEEKTVEDVHFELSRELDAQGYIAKTICVQHLNKQLHYRERVRAFTYSDFEQLFDQAGLRIRASFGNYALDPFEVTSSSRLILIAEKI